VKKKEGRYGDKLKQGGLIENIGVVIDVSAKLVCSNAIS